MSTSEILAGILKDDVENATIVGTKTYGKGVIQSLYTLSDGSGLKLTTDEYFTPNHNEINKIGITPDEIVEGYKFSGKIGITPDEIVEGYKFSGKLDKENDTQLKKAIELLKQKN